MVTGFQDHHSDPRPPGLYPLQEARKFPCKMNVSHLQAEQLALHSQKTLPWSHWDGLRVPPGPAQKTADRLMEDPSCKFFYKVRMDASGCQCPLNRGSASGGLGGDSERSQVLSLMGPGATGNEVIHR